MSTLLTKYRALSRRGKVLATTGAVIFVAACGGGGLAGIQTLGAGFVQAFNADMNSDPVDPDTIALTVDPTIDPFNP